VCDNVDNDMDDLVDENTDQPCQVDCHMGRRLCIEGAYIGCTAMPASEEICNGEDDDCDGLIDEMSPCAETEICGEEGICLRGCLAGECPDGFMCVDEYCRPIPCDPPCVVGAVCREQACYLECTIDRDCPDRFVCRGGLCAVDTVSNPMPMPMPGVDAGPPTRDGFLPPIFDMGVAAVPNDEVQGCNCDTSAPEGPPWVLLLGFLGLARVRRRVASKGSGRGRGRGRPRA
jgi:MYXO-CTERM domain-containing protein